MPESSPSQSPNPKRFSVGPLGQYDDDLLTAWAALHGSSKGAAAKEAIAGWLAINREEIREQVRLYAECKGIGWGDAFQLLLSGEDEAL